MRTRPGKARSWRMMAGGAAVAALVATSCTPGGTVSVGASRSASSLPGGAEPVDLAAPRPVPGDPDPLVRAGAAGRFVDCDGPGNVGGTAPDFARPGVNTTPEAALDAFLKGRQFGLPATGYRQVASEDGRVLFTYEVAGQPKVAVIVANVSTGVRFMPHGGWAIEIFATCDPSEFSPSNDNELLQTVWTDRQRQRVPTSTITSFAGAAHCDWESVTFLSLEDRQYLRDPEGALVTMTVVPYDGDTELPADAVDTGYRHGLQQLWLADDQTIAYLVTGDHVEAWPSTPEPVGCD